MSEHLEGYVEHIIYRNEENGYTVFETVVNKKPVTCTGLIVSISEGEFVEMEGEETIHPLYGEQFRVTSCHTAIPGDLRALERYLSSGAVKGVGPALASRIIKRFGEDTLRIIEEEPERLAEVKGISENKACDISAQIVERSQVRDAMIFLSGYGISQNMSMKIYQLYGESVYSILRDNPYQLIDDIPGIGFKTADLIAEKAGISRVSPFRLSCGIVYTLGRALADGHMFLPEEKLKEDALAILAVENILVDEALDELSISGKIIRKRDEKYGTIVYQDSAYYTELDTARRLSELNVEFEADENDIRKKLKKIAKTSPVEPDELQTDAVIRAARHGVFILTGGPGTGKTTTINTMIRYFMAEDCEIALAAPTGRAAKRMEEATGFRASTIHRLLEITGDPSNDDLHIRFTRNKDNPLEADVVIIDEVSMVDIFLMHSLLEALLPGTRLILVGDMNQLPSVGPGKVLSDLIASGCFETILLNRIFRQAAQSDIIVNAHRIKNGEKVRLDNSSKDFFFLERKDYRVIQKAVITLVSEKLPKYTGSEMKDVQVITPMRKGVLGVENLNIIMQKYLNPPSEDKHEKETPTGCFREGDKVMQIRNDYQLCWEIRGLFGIVSSHGEGVFNGDIGTIETIRPFDQTVTVVFEDNKYVDYSFSQLDELELAYAVTVHKSQGSEYPAVVIPLLDAPQILLTRNLIYTAVTRAQKCVILLGSPETLDYCIRNKREEMRFSTLADMLASLRQ
ncbi:MAG: ATP-dependent RecD-like DNA helicase [Lachnospiraceae bacterium]|nr:ATP-dependent RecD-like DNA helicase [Lachnospiraceae bacterium]